MPSRRDRKLKNYLINNDLQLRVILIILLHMILVVIITVGVSLSPFIQDMLLTQDLEIQYRAAQMFLHLIKRLIPAVAAIFFLVFLHQVIITHRICGPLVNFSNTFTKIAQGDLTRKIYLRKGDYLKNECDRINTMVDNLGDLISQVGKDQAKLMSLLEETLTRVEDVEACTRIDDALQLIKHQAEAVSQKLESFRFEKSS
ncbi:hypothetical protein ACFL9U_18180 [Thermodesulfobacteriota bacterium]